VWWAVVKGGGQSVEVVDGSGRGWDGSGRGW
jgi:hypothetical protein